MLDKTNTWCKLVAENGYLLLESQCHKLKQQYTGITTGVIKLQASQHSSIELFNLQDYAN